MRLIKLSKSVFNNIIQVYNYFDYDLRHSRPIGKFKFPKRFISKDKLIRGEHLLFSYDSIIRFVGRSKSQLHINNTTKYDKY